MGCGLQSSSTWFLFAVAPSAGVGLPLVDARLEWGRGAGILLPPGVAGGAQDGERLCTGQRVPPTRKGRLSGPEESISGTSPILERGRSGSMPWCWAGGRSPLLLPVSHPS